MALCFTNVHIFQSAGGGYQSASLGAPALDTGLTSPDTYGAPQVETNQQELGWLHNRLSEIVTRIG